MKEKLQKDENGRNVGDWRGKKQRKEEFAYNT